LAFFSTAGNFKSRLTTAFAGNKDHKLLLQNVKFLDTNYFY